MSIFMDLKVTRRSLLLSTCGLIPGIRVLNALGPVLTASGYAVKPVPLAQVEELHAMLRRGALLGRGAVTFDA